MSVLKGKLHRLKQRKTSAGKHDEDLGLWKLENFELCPTYCELRYQSPLEPGDYASKPSRHSPGFQVCGYIIGSTEVRRGPRVMLDSSSANENDGLQKRQAWVYMFEVIFFIESVDRIEDHTVVLGHVDQGGREKWVKAIESLIQERRHMSNGFDSFFSNRQALDREEREWIEKRDGRYVEHINRDIWKQARLRNGKVFKDLEKVFVKYSKEETEMTAAGHEFKSRRMALGDVLVALDELGINYFGPNGARLLERIKRHQRLEDEAAVERDKFVEIFKWCFEDRTRPPSAEMKEKLVDIMDRSANVFLTLLTPDEKVALVEGEDAAGVPNCTVQTWAKGSVVVKQGDEGDSMYCVVEGELSVVVSFGSTDKEVAVLGPGGVVGEMSLVFGKARSATCVVHSAECIVAEIRHNVMDALLRRRPMLQRELYEISLQREMANNRTKATTVLDSDFGLPDPAADRPPPPAPRPAPQKRLKPHPGRFGPSVGGPRERLAWIAQCGRADRSEGELYKVHTAKWIPTGRGLGFKVSYD